MFSIHSAYSDRELIFRPQDNEHLEVELRGHGLSARVSVWLYQGTDSLNTFFQRLASLKEPWQDAHTWESMEGEFSLSATCTILGQVTFSVMFRQLIGTPEDWQIEANLVTELGQLNKIAKDANTVFRQNSA